MGIEEEILQLVYQVKGLEQGQQFEASLDRQRRATDALNAELADLDAAYGRGAVTGANYVAGKARIAAALDREEAAHRKLAEAAEDAGRRVADAARLEEGRDFNRMFAEGEATVDKFTAAGARAAGSSRNLGRSLLESGRIVQDFAQGGIGGILNNIEGMTMALGLGSGLAGVLTVAGVAAALAGPKLIELFKSMTGSANEIPKAIDPLKRWEEQLKANDKALDKLRDQTSLSNSELATFNRLTGESAELEAKIAAEREKRQRARQADGQSKEERERGQGAQAAIDGRHSEIQGKLTGALNRQVDFQIGQEEGATNRRIQKFMNEGGHTEEEKDAFSRDQSARFQDFKSSLTAGKAQNGDVARDLLDRFMQGEKGMEDRLANLLGGAYGARNADPAFVARMRANNPETKAAAEAKQKADEAKQGADKKALEDVRKFLDDEFDRDLKELKDASKADGKAEKAGAAAGKEGDKAAARDAQDAAKAADDAAKAQIGKVDATVGAPYRQRYEAAMARNALANEQGGGLDPAEMERRLRLEMFAMLRKRGASPEVARRASDSIADKGNADLGRRMAQLNNAQGSNQEKLITLAAGLSGEMARAVQVQQRHGQAINALMQGQQARQRTGRSRGRGG